MHGQVAAVEVPRLLRSGAAGRQREVAVGVGRQALLPEEDGTPREGRRGRARGALRVVRRRW